MRRLVVLITSVAAIAVLGALACGPGNDKPPLTPDNPEMGDAGEMPPSTPSPPSK